MRSRNRALAGGLAVVAVGLTWPAAGLGATDEYPTAFTKFKYEVSGSEAEFKGKINSTKGGCIPDRKVVLYRKHNGKTKKLGGDRTSNKGKFKIELGSGAPKEGTYYAEVNRAKIGDSGDKTCLARTSPSVKLS